MQNSHCVTLRSSRDPRETPNISNRIARHDRESGRTSNLSLQTRAKRNWPPFIFNIPLAFSVGVETFTSLLTRRAEIDAREPLITTKKRLFASIRRESFAKFIAGVFKRKQPRFVLVQFAAVTLAVLEAFLNVFVFLSITTWFCASCRFESISCASCRFESSSSTRPFDTYEPTVAGRC